jgi:hypothetical protein
MLSDASKTARIGQLGTGASLSGNFIIQRYISARDTSYSDLSSPVQGTSFSDWGSELPAISYIHTPPTALASAYTYDESGDAYVALTSSGDALSPGKGYEVFLAGDYSYGAFPNTTMNTIGVPNQGSINLSSLISNNAQGWNLVGNPFASSVSWSAIYAASGGASSGLYDYVEMYDYTIGDWSGYTSGDGIEMGSSQGFWVYGLPGATSLSLIVPEASKTSSSNSSIKQVAIHQPYFTIKLRTENSAANYSHTFKMSAKEGAEDGFDRYDLPFRASPNKATPQLYSMVDGKKINVNSFPADGAEQSIQLSTVPGYSGEYVMEAAGFEFLGKYTCFQLEDKLKNRMIDLEAQPFYRFEMKTTDNPNRFVIHFSNAECDMVSKVSKENTFENQVAIAHSNEADLIDFNFNQNTAVRIEVSNLLGQQIIAEREINIGTGTERLVLPFDFKGVYLIKVSSEEGSMIRKFIR